MEFTTGFHHLPRWPRYHLSEDSGLLYRARRRAHSIAAIRQKIGIYYLYPNPDVVMLGRLKTRDLTCLLYTSPSPRDRTRSRMPSSA